MNPSLEVVAAISDADTCAEDCCPAHSPMNDRDPKFAGRALPHKNGYVNFAVAVKVRLQIKWLHLEGNVVILRE